mmetsp:Transcript_65566/g.128928  ORF Transcript_65566/g.128928 Transcript_65566/m.128928 type:complete len:256 (+) Transcript_65566:47-814(+)
MMHSLSWSFSNFTLAFAFVFATTADDSVWLIPMIATQKYSKAARLLHALVFIIGLQFACFLSWALCDVSGGLLLTAGVKIDHQVISAALLVQIVGTVLTWIVVIVLFVRKMMKTCHRNRQTGDINNHLEASQTELTHITQTETTSLLPTAHKELALNTHLQQDSPNLWLVFSMTIAGAADEIMCFPPLLLGNTFSALELTAGTLAASLLLIIILLSFYSVFKSCFDVLDQIPLYFVVAVLAVIQTVDVVYELNDL